MIALPRNDPAVFVDHLELGGEPGAMARRPSQVEASTE